MEEIGSGLRIYYQSSSGEKVLKLKFNESSKKLTSESDYDTSSCESRLAYNADEDVGVATAITSSTYGFRIIESLHQINLDMSSLIDPADDYTAAIETERVFYFDSKYYALLKISENFECSGGVSWVLMKIDELSFEASYGNQNQHTICGDNSFHFASQDKSSGKIIVGLKTGDYSYKLYSFSNRFKINRIINR